MFIRRNKKLRTKKVSPGIVALIAVVLAAGGFGLWQSTDEVLDQQSVELAPGEFPKKVVETKDDQAEEKPEEVKKPMASETATYPITLNADQSSSITVVVNKKHKLPSSYIPGLSNVRGASLRSEAASALENLLSTAETAGLGVKIVSSYRSYATQQSVYGGYVNQYGQAQADTFSARPGHSEHQTGLAVDVGNSNGDCELETCFGTTSFGEWIKTNAHLYGYIVRYPNGQESATGYQYEPWHLRYIGETVANAVYSSGQTLDQYYGIPAGSY